MDIIESHTAPSASDPGGIESSGFFQARRNSKSLTDIVCLPTLYDHLNREVERDSKAKKEVIQNKRIGFYRLRTQIGAGNFSKVKLGIHLLTNERVAIKVIDKTGLDEHANRILSREIACMVKLNHPSIIRLFEVIESFSALHLVMECASNSDLQDRVMNDGPYKEDMAQHIFSQIAAAINHMHNKNVIHCDIKAGNIFFLNDTTIKIGDFGFSSLSDASDYLDTFCGSPPYAAPELFAESSYLGPPVDIWASGITLYFMLTGAMPFYCEDISKLKHRITKGEFPIPADLTLHCRLLISGILNTDVKKRYTMEDIFNSPWLNKSVCNDELFSSSQAATTSNDSLENLRASFCVAEVEGAIDTEIIHELKMIGLPVPENIDVLSEPRDPTTGAYRILLHKKQTESLRKFLMERKNSVESSSLHRTSLQRTLRNCTSSSKKLVGKMSGKRVDDRANLQRTIKRTSRRTCIIL